MPFENLSPVLSDALTARGYEALTPVQTQVSEDQAKGRDLLVSAHSLTFEGKPCWEPEAPWFVICRALHVAGVHTSTTVLGAQLYFWGRVAYVPLYAFGVKQVRSLVWMVATLGLGMIAVAVLTA